MVEVSGTGATGLLVAGLPRPFDLRPVQRQHHARRYRPCVAPKADGTVEQSRSPTSCPSYHEVPKALMRSCISPLHRQGVRLAPHDGSYGRAGSLTTAVTTAPASSLCSVSALPSAFCRSRNTEQAAARCRGGTPHASPEVQNVLKHCRQEICEIAYRKPGNSQGLSTFRPTANSSRPAPRSTPVNAWAQSSPTAASSTPRKPAALWSRRPSARKENSFRRFGNGRDQAPAAGACALTPTAS